MGVMTRMEEKEGRRVEETAQEFPGSRRKRLSAATSDFWRLSPPPSPATPDCCTVNSLAALRGILTHLSSVLLLNIYEWRIHGNFNGHVDVVRLVSTQHRLYWHSGAVTRASLGHGNPRSYTPGTKVRGGCGGLLGGLTRAMPSLRHNHLFACHLRPLAMLAFSKNPHTVRLGSCPSRAAWRLASPCLQG